MYLSIHPSVRPSIYMCTLHPRFILVTSRGFPGINLSQVTSTLSLWGDRRSTHDKFQRLKQGGGGDLFGLPNTYQLYFSRKSKVFRPQENMGSQTYGIIIYRLISPVLTAVSLKLTTSSNVALRSVVKFVYVFQRGLLPPPSEKCTGKPMTNGVCANSGCMLSVHKQINKSLRFTRWRTTPSVTAYIASPDIKKYHRWIISAVTRVLRAVGGGKR